MKPNVPILTRAQIQEILPHREPFIFIASIIELELGKRAVGLLDDFGKPPYDYWVRGHFPGFPVVPGVIIVEALAEVGAVAALGMPENHHKLAVLTGLDKWKFRRFATPGSTVRLEVELTRMRRSFGMGHARALDADGQVLSEGDIAFGIVDRPADFPAPQP